MDPGLRSLDGALADAALRPSFWPGGAGPVQVCHTHASVVLLCGDRAWKLRKPVRFAFLDYGTPEARRVAALEEVCVNAPLAPGTYLGVRPIVRDAAGVLSVGQRGTQPPGTIDHVVEMRRFDERDTLAARLADDRVPPGALADLGRALAAFHDGADPADDGTPAGAAALLTRLHRNAEELLALGDDGPGAGAIGRLHRTLEAAVLRDADVHDARARAGLRRDGHGDLRADHVVLEPDGLRVVDRLEFDRRLRCDDVAGDLAYLLMDLEARGAPQAAQEVLGGYRTAGGDAGDDRVLAVWTAYRALVAAKVHRLRAAQGDEAGAATATARLALAWRCAWRTRLPLVLVCCGAPATGKSTLAAALAARSGLPVLSSDHVRRDARGVPAGRTAPADIYADEVSQALYGELGRRAAALAAESSGGVIVDATMRSAVLRAAFADGLGHDKPTPVFAQCVAPAAVALRRAAGRVHDPGRESDAGPQVTAALTAAFEPLDEIPPDRHLLLRGDEDTGCVMERLEAALDALTIRAPGRRRR